MTDRIVSAFGAFTKAREVVAGHDRLYLEDCAQAGPWTAELPYRGVMPHALDPEAADRLWSLSVATTGA